MNQLGRNLFLANTWRHLFAGHAAPTEIDMAAITNMSPAELAELLQVAYRAGKMANAQEAITVSANRDASA